MSSYPLIFSEVLIYTQISSDPLIFSEVLVNSSVVMLIELLS